MTELLRQSRMDAPQSLNQGRAHAPARLAKTIMMIITPAHPGTGRSRLD
ncbi:hypothetical protein [Phenylobacterium zucineum]|nr:hypothetical protein [Phenylobacterium zucineum]